MSIKAVKAVTNAILTVDRLSPEGSTLGKFARRKSEFAKHVVYVSKNELEHELADLIYRSLGYDSSSGQYNYELQQGVSNTDDAYVFTDPELKMLTGIVFNNLNKAFKDLQNQYKDNITISPYLDGFKVDIFTAGNNYEIIGRAFSKAWEGEGQYGNLKNFIRNTLGSKSSMYKQVKGVEESSKSGLDRGHGKSAEDDISNIENLIKVVGINSIKDSYNISDVTNLTEQQLGVIEKDLNSMLGNVTTLDQMWVVLRRSGAIQTSFEEFQGLIETYINTTVSLFREVANGKIKLNLIAEEKITDTNSLGELMKKLEIAIRPQSALLNQAQGGSVQAKLAEILRRRNAEVFKNINEWLSGKAVSVGKGKNKRSFPPLPMELEGSDTLKKMMGDTIYESFTLGKSKNKRANTAVNIAAHPSKVNIGKLYTVKSESKKFVENKKLNVTKIRREQEKDQVNIINIVNLINMKLAETIRQNMGSPRLNYRTGRFASSAKVLPGMMDKDGALRLPYTYMKYPYQTFEPGFARGSTARDPKAVIGESIKELAIKLVLIKLRVVRV